MTNIGLEIQVQYLEHRIEDLLNQMESPKLKCIKRCNTRIITVPHKLAGSIQIEELITPEACKRCNDIRRSTITSLARKRNALKEQLKPLKNLLESIKIYQKRLEEEKRLEKERLAEELRLEQIRIDEQIKLDKEEKRLEQQRVAEQQTISSDTTQFIPKETKKSIGAGLIAVGGIIAFLALRK